MALESLFIHGFNLSELDLETFEQLDTQIMSEILAVHSIACLNVLVKQYNKVAKNPYKIKNA